jgi:hypothetical protein
VSELVGAAIWLAVLVGLGVLFVVVVRRIGFLLARTRELEALQRSVAELDAAFGAAADQLLGSLDSLVRGRAADVAAVAAVASALPHAAASLRETADRARRLEAPAGLSGEVSGIVRELDRAARAADLASLGLEGLLAGRSDRQGEAGVDLKRGSLNLRSARDMVRAIAGRVGALTPAEFASRRESPWSRRGEAPVIYVADGTDEDANQGLGPRM